MMKPRTKEGKRDRYKSLFITGTDTNIGKTVISAILCKKFRMPYWKPIQSGVGVGDVDADFVAKTAGVKTHTSIKLQEPLSPHLAAKIDGVSITLDTLVPPFRDIHICEGAGGVFVPLNGKYMMIDLIKMLGYEVIVVARSSLGTINHTCLTVEVLRQRGIPVLGVVMNGDLNEDNKNAIEMFAQTKVLGHVPQLQNLEVEIATAGQYISL